MPIILCEYCEYIGQGETTTEQLSDTETHEKTCEFKEDS